MTKTEQKVQEIAQIIGILCIWVLIPLILWLIWDFSWLPFKVILTDLVILITCFAITKE